MQLATVAALLVSISVRVSVYVGVNVPKIDQPNYVDINLRDGAANKNSSGCTAVGNYAKNLKQPQLKKKHNPVMEKI